MYRQNLLYISHRPIWSYYRRIFLIRINFLFLRFRDVYGRSLRGLSILPCTILTLITLLIQGCYNIAFTAHHAALL